MPTTTQSEFGNISNAVGVYHTQRAIMEARKQRILYRLGIEENIPKNSSTLIRFTKVENLTPVVTPVQGAATPTGEEISIDHIDATLRQYIKWVPLRKDVMDTKEDPYLRHVSSLLGWNMKDSFETLDTMTLLLGTNVFFANNVAGRVNVVNTLSAGDVERAVTYLRDTEAMPYTSFISASPKVGTRPVEECYFGLCNAKVERSVRKLPDFLKVVEYGSSTTTMPGEFGAAGGVRWIRHNYSKPWNGAGGAVAATIDNTAGQANVHPVMIFARGAFATSKLMGTEFMKLIIKTPGSSGSDDPANQRGSAAWCGWHAVKILEDKYMLRLEVAAEAL